MAFLVVGRQTLPHKIREELPVIQEEKDMSATTLVDLLLSNRYAYNHHLRTGSFCDTWPMTG